MAKLETVRVETDSDMESFVELPWKIYRSDSKWVPPLKKMIGRLLDSSLHPYWKFSERALFLVKRGSETLGRIAAIVDNNHNSYHHCANGAWGFFECVNDLEVAQRLFSEASEWVRWKGMTYFYGPMNPSTNYEVGLLVDGFEKRPSLMMPYNPPYYVNLLESSGFRKEKDLLSFVVDRSSPSPPEWMRQMADRVRKDARFIIRHPEMSKFQDELKLLKDVYDESWAENWGFVPMTEYELAEMAQTLVKFADPDLLFFVYYEEKPIAAAVSVPDISPILLRLNGKLGIIGLLKSLFYRKEVKGVKGLLFGVKKKYREMGIPFLAMDHTYKMFQRKPEYDYLELGWNLEENAAINQLEMDYGAKPFKRHRIYGKTFSDRW